MSSNDNNSEHDQDQSNATTQAEDVNNVEEEESSNESSIPEEVLVTWKETFSLFDFDSTGFIASEDLGSVIRGLGFNCREEELIYYLNQFDHDGSGKIDFPTVYQILVQNSPMRPPATAQEIIDKLNSFDMYKKGSLTVNEFIDILRNMGEPLTRDDVDNLLLEIQIDGDNRINIQEFVMHMCRTSQPQ